MTHADWSAILAPLLIAVLTGIVSVLTALWTLGIARVRAWLDARGQAAIADALTGASNRVQAAMDNAAGRIVLGIQAGTVDAASLPDLRRAAATEAEGIKAKLPDALAALKPLEGAVLEGILGKVGGKLSVALPKAA